MRTQSLLSLFLLLGLATSAVVEGKTVFRRTDKISENFKQLDLQPEEIDPNVAPPEPQKIDTIDPEDLTDSTGGTADADADATSDSDGDVDVVADEVIDEAEEEAAAAAASASAATALVDESANEVDGVVAVATPVPAAAASAASAAASASDAIAAPVTTTAAVPAEATTPIKNPDDPNGLSKYCKCKDNQCDCCRKFSLPLIPISGPGCARISYLGNEKMSVSLKYGDITLATRTISSKNARPICVGLPGGYSKFCGRVYGLAKAEKKDFKACLGFELRAEDEVEAALRVSCFKFGPEGLRVAEAEPLPAPPKDEDDDDDDIFGFAADPDDEEDEDDYGADEADEEEDEDEEDDDDVDEEEDDDDDTEAEAEAPEDADYGGFSLGALFDDLEDDDEDTTAGKPPTVSGITPPPAVDQTRNAGVGVSVGGMAQSKDDKGTAAAVAATAAAETALSVDDAALTPLPVAAPAAAHADSVPATTTNKTKKSKKAKKNKKKKAVSGADADAESDFAFEILNGILDFFN